MKKTKIRIELGLEVLGAQIGTAVILTNLPEKDIPRKQVIKKIISDSFSTCLERLVLLGAEKALEEKNN